MGNFKKELIKLAVHHDVAIEDWIRDDKLDEFHLETTRMYNAGELVTDYSKECRLRVLEAEGVEEFDVNKFRVYFLSKYSGEVGYAGNKPEITRLLVDYMSKHPGHSYEMICKAAKAYVDSARAKDQFIMKAENFILNSEGKSTLAVVVEDLQSSDEENQGLYELI